MRLPTLFVFIFIFSIATAQSLPAFLTQIYNASVQDQAPNFFSSVCSVVDDHLYVTGESSTSLFGQPSNSSSSDVVFFQVLRNGSLGWFRFLGSKELDYPTGITTDPNNNYLYIAGYTKTYSTFNGVQTIGGDDVFVMQVFKSNGTVKSTVLLGTLLDDRPGRVDYCTNDNTIVIPWTNGTTMQVTKLNSSLGTVWTRETGVYGVTPRAIKCTSNGIYVTGIFNQTVLYMKLNSAGILQVVTNITSNASNWDEGYDITVSGSNAYIVGSIGGTFMGHTVWGDSDPVIIRADESTGNYLSHLIINASSGYDADQRIKIDSDNNVLVYGSRGSLLYLYKLNSMLNLTWTAATGGIGVVGVSIDPYASNVLYLGASTDWPFGFQALGVIDTTASVPSPSPTPSVTPSTSVSSTPTRTPSITPSTTPSPSASVTPTASVSPSRTPSVSPSVTPSTSASASVTPSVTPSLTPSTTPSPSETPSSSPSSSPSITPSSSITPSRTPSPTNSPTPTSSITPSITPTSSATPSATPSISVSASITPSASSSPEKSASKSSKKNTAGIAAGVVVGVVASVGLLLGAFLVLKRCRKNQKLAEEEDSQAPATELPEYSNSQVKPNQPAPSTSVEYANVQPPKRKTTIPDFEYLDDIEIKEVIGSGSFGEVFRGVWKGTQQVALKKLIVDDKMEEFLQEAAMLQKCSFDHVVKFVGLHRDSNHTVYMVTEFMSGGALNNLLQKVGKTLGAKTLLEMARDAAEGIRSMADKGLVHRDLAARNLLVHVEDGHYTVKVADFGLARHLAGNYYTSIKSVFPIKWSAPEVLKFEKFSVKSDVWSFGIVLWEIFENGSLPYRGMGNNEATEAVINGYRLPKPNRCPDSVYVLMMQCWAEEPSDRPSFDEICNKLNEILKTEQFDEAPPKVPADNENTFYANRTETPK
mmetsp:Transcript_23883/g.33477  ORF Transcript_23883/g.33477 Transcript_23883/m.33477 type:complete len:928 (-) Transcript_23883:126-2909(-)